MSLNDFKTLINTGGGIAKPTHYKIVLPNLNSGDRDIQDMQLLCNATTLPGDQIMTNDRVIGMKPELMAYSFSHGDVQLTFYETNKYQVKKYFDTWKSNIIDQNDKTLKYKSEYAKTVTIHQLNSMGDSVYSVELIDAFPTTISEIQLGARNTDSVTEINVQLSYTTYKVV